MTVPGLHPKALLSLRTGVKQNAHYTTDNEILYPAGAVLLLHDFPQQSQRYIKLMEKSIFLEMIAVSPTKSMAAIVLNDEKGQIIIYDMKTLKKKRTLHLPQDANTKRFEYICFSHDEKLILTVTGDPDWMMLSYNWEKGKVETFTRANYINNPGPVTVVLCSPTDSAACCLLGPGLFRLMSMQETVWRQYGFQKAEQVNITTAAFLGGDRVIIGTGDGKLLLVDNGELKALYDAVTVDVIVVVEKEEGATTVPVVIPKAIPESEMTEDRQVRAMTPFIKGFAYSCRSGEVHMFEKEGKNKYRRRNLFVIRDPDFREIQTKPLNIVRHMSVNPSQDKLLATTNRSQIYTVQLWGPTITEAPQIPFKHHGESLHHGPISGLATCSWKPQFMTSGAEDRTVRIWNYETSTLEMLKQYEEDVFSVALHPTGLFAAIGFTDKLRYMIVQLDDMQPCRNFPIPGCYLTNFSSNGHYLAAVNKLVIYIYSTVSFRLVWKLKGHSGHISSLVWTPDDRKLVSCGEEGAVYEWDVTTGTRIAETVEKKVSFWECAITEDGKFVYAVGNDGQVKEICDSNVLRTFSVGQKDLPHVVLSRSDQMMFACGEAGIVISLKMPLLEPIDYQSFLFHNSRILKMKLTYDDKTLLTVSETGSLCIWNVLDDEGRAVIMEKDFAHCSDVLIPKNELEEKVARIQELSQRMQELVLEHEYAMREIDVNHSLTVKEIETKYSNKIDDLNERIKKEEAQHSREAKNLTSEISALKEINEKAIQDVEGKYNSKLIVEYEKYNVAQQEKENIIQQYEKKIVAQADAKDKVISKIEMEYKSQLAQLQLQLDQSREKNNQEKMEHEEIKRQIEDDADREIIELKAKYEYMLKDQKDLNEKLNSDSGVMNKKFFIAQKENEKHKALIAQQQTEQSKFQDNIQELQKDIIELKKEIYERDLIIHDKEKKIYDMKKKTEELEKYKFVLSHKIEELKNQIEPKEFEIEKRDKQITEMEEELENMQAAKDRLIVKISEQKEKVISTETELRKYKDKYEKVNTNLKKIKIDILKVSAHIQDIRKLKEGVKRMFEKYAQSEETKRAHQGEVDLAQEFMRQREHLEHTVSTLTTALARAREKQSDYPKIMQENVILIEEINTLRKALKENEDKIIRYEKILISSTGKQFTVREAHKRLQQAIKSQDEIREEMLMQIQEYQQEIKILQQEINRLVKQKGSDS